MTAARLLAWYSCHRRDLPWRRDHDPYRVWLSEVMLQQTRVEVVVPYFERFVERFPDVHALAAADVDTVLAAWSGLGYYRRARQLHATARQVSASGGRFPSTVDGLLALPGIGPYTAAAIASIAFGVPVPVVDGNVERVTARLLALASDPRAAAGRARVTALAALLLDPRQPGDSNQALMELGATLCTPRRPDCTICPLREPAPEVGGELTWPGCRAVITGAPEDYPLPRPRRQVERRRRLVALVEDETGRLLLFRRPHAAALLAGTWELPSVPWEETAAASELGGELAERYGGRWSIGERLATARHAITFRDLELIVHRAELEVAEGSAGSDAGSDAEAAWHHRPGLAGLALSSMVGKVLAAVATRGATVPTRGVPRRR